MLGLYSAGTDPVAAVVFLALMGGALGPVYMATQNAMPHCAPGRTDIALAANSGSYNAGMAPGAALGGLILPLADVPNTFLAGGLLMLTVGACGATRRVATANATESAKQERRQWVIGAFWSLIICFRDARSPPRLSWASSNSARSVSASARAAVSSLSR